MTQTNAVLQGYREDLHRIPELSFDLPRTLEYVRAHVEKLGGQVTEPAASSVCVYFDAGADTTIAFRADMDGLPVFEDADRPYGSTHPGKMHACGHDGHMAMLLGLCDYVSENRDSLTHNVLAIFQPAEETEGGARPICESGVLQKYGVNVVFGLHMWAGVPAGQIVSRAGELMARSSEITVEVVGKSVHIAKAAQGHNAMLAVCKLVDRVHEQVSALPPTDHRLLNFGYLQSGTVRNALAGTAHLEGTMRAFSDRVYDRLQSILLDTALEAQQDTGCQVNVKITDGYPAVINDAKLFELVQSQVDLPIDILEEPQMTGEDFSFYQREVPGVFFFVGTGFDAPLHSPEFDMDPAALTGGLDLLKSLLNLDLSQLEPAK